MNHQTQEPNKHLSTFVARLTEPIYSFPGKAPTEEEMKIINAMKALIEKDIAKK